MTLSIDDEILQRARRKAESMRTSVNQLIREYLGNFSGRGDAPNDADEFERLSRIAKGDSRGWRFDREELHRRA